MKKLRDYLTGSAILLETIIGAGVLGIPYVVAKSGFLIGALMIVFLGAAILTTNLFVGEFVLRTKGNHQFTGYAEKYLGKTGKKLMTATMAFGIYGALIAYIIGTGESLSAIFGLTPFIFSIISFAVMSLIVYIGLKTIGKIEVLVSFVVLFIVLFISAVSLKYINLANLATVDLSKAFLPYGVILFAFAGAAAIPEMKEILTRDRKIMKKCIIIASVIPLIAYFIFAATTVGATGLNTTEIATIGLGKLLGKNMLIFGNLFAIFAMAGSFLTLGLALKEMFNYDLKFNNNLSWAFACLVPFIIFLAGIKSFIKTIGITGAVAGGVEGILLISIFLRARKSGNRKPEYHLKVNSILPYSLILVYIGGVIYTIWELI